MNRYIRPPLHESSAELRFRPGEPWDPTIPGLLYEQLRGTWPQKRQARRLEVQTRVVDGQLVPLVRDQSGEIQFISPDGLSGVRLDVNMLGYQRVGTYPGWSRMREEMRRALEGYTEIAGPSAFEQLRLRFVNRIELASPSPQFDISRILNVWPRVPPKLAGSFGRFLVKLDLPEPELRGHLVLTTGIAEGQPEGAGLALLLELDFLSIQPPVPLEAAEHWLDAAHGRLVEAFEAAITDEARARFEPAG
jgi:uncharacterized protein (TIGR04255 family)